MIFGFRVQCDKRPDIASSGFPGFGVLLLADESPNLIHVQATALENHTEPANLFKHVSEDTKMVLDIDPSDCIHRNYSRDFVSDLSPRFQPDFKLGHYRPLSREREPSLPVHLSDE